MTLDEAIRNLESKFEGRVAPATSTDEAPDLPRVCSGGVIDKDELFPALYSSKELAVEAWFEQATSHVGYARAKLQWVLKPELMEFQITMADRLQRQRLVANRFAVKSQFKVEK